MTSLPPPAASATPSARRALHWTSFTFFTLFGLGLETSPAWSGAEQSVTATIGWVLLGLAVLTAPVMTWARFLAPRHPHRAIVTHGDVLEIRLRTGIPTATAVLGTVWSVLGVWAVIAGGATSGGLLAVPFVALFAALVPDSVRAATRRPHLRVDAEGIRMRGWSLDGHVAWDDTVGLDFLTVRTHRPVIRLVARTGAASLSRTWHRYLVHLDLKTEEPVLDIPVLALDDPARVSAFLAVMRNLQRDGRLLELQSAGPAFLRGEIQLDT